MKIYSPSYNLYPEFNVLLKIFYYHLLKTDIEKVPKIIGTSRNLTQYFYSYMNNSSIVVSRARANLKASSSVGSYLLFSIALTVCLLTPHIDREYRSAPFSS